MDLLQREEVGRADHQLNEPSQVPSTNYGTYYQRSACAKGSSSLTERARIQCDNALPR